MGFSSQLQADLLPCFAASQQRGEATVCHSLYRTIGLGMECMGLYMHMDHTYCISKVFTEQTLSNTSLMITTQQCQVESDLRSGVRFGHICTRNTV